MDREDRDHFKTMTSALVAPLGVLPKKQELESSVSAQCQPDPDFFLERTRILFACYRKDEAHDPEMYCAAVAAVLSIYPQWIVILATDPRTGLASTMKFLPTPAEVKEFCDNEAEKVEHDRLRDERIRQQFTERELFELEQADKANRPTYDELKDKYGDGKGGWLARDRRGKDAADEAKSIMRETHLRASETILSRECAAAGIDPGRGVSPSLLETLKGQKHDAS
jgi:hypothetical protein